MTRVEQTFYERNMESIMTDKLPDFSMDKANLYREELYTDHRAGTLRKMIPVTENGALDPERPTYFVGETQVMTPMGALPVSFEIQTVGAFRFPSISHRNVRRKSWLPSHPWPVSQCATVSVACLASRSIERRPLDWLG